MSSPRFTRYVQTAVISGYISKTGADILLSLPIAQDVPSIICAIKFDDVVSLIDKGELFVDARILFDSVPRNIVLDAYTALGELASDNLLKSFDETLELLGCEESDDEHDSNVVPIVLQFIEAVFTGVGHWVVESRNFLEVVELEAFGVTPNYEDPSL